jgi:hypothetical protein
VARSLSVPASFCPCHCPIDDRLQHRHHQRLVERLLQRQVPAPSPPPPLPLPPLRRFLTAGSGNDRLKYQLSQRQRLVLTADSSSSPQPTVPVPSSSLAPFSPAVFLPLSWASFMSTSLSLWNLLEPPCLLLASVFANHHAPSCLQSSPMSPTLCLVLRMWLWPYVTLENWLKSLQKPSTVRENCNG